MKLVAQSAPYIRKPVSVKRMMLDVLIALVPVLLFACIQNGWNGIYVVLISVATMLVTELVCHMFIKWPSGMKIKELFSKEGFIKLKNQYTINNIIAPLISAIIYALIMPAGCNWYVVLIGALFGMLIGKMIFGGLGSNIFNPAATGRVFVGVCFGSKLVYGQGGVDVVASGTPLAAVKGNLGMVGEALHRYSLLDLFLGQIPGSMGEVCSLLIIVGGIYLFVRRSADLRACLSMIGSFAIITLVVSIVAYCVWNNEIKSIPPHVDMDTMNVS
ncbi:MAG: RnfABCDGE type electron transport complex subunit D [Anaeroplasmataceae bacterium]|nr:RnfABCDGE type electron transport complex subunit D [Anaeroplasmataceae bacterium]